MGLSVAYMITRSARASMGSVFLPQVTEIKQHAPGRPNYDAAGGASATINRELSAIKRMFSLGIQAEKIFRTPYIPMRAEHNVRQGFYERAEFLTVRAALPDYLKPVVTFAYFTGWRRGEIAGSSGVKSISLRGQCGSRVNQPRTTRRG